MPTLSRDTSEDVERVLIEGYRRKTPGQRVALAADTTDCMRRFLQAGIRLQYPNASEEEIRKRFAARWLGRDWSVRLFGWDPNIHGW